MKKALMAILFFYLPISLMAQVMDKTNIEKLEKGEYRLESGKIQVTFVDTVSQEFVVSQLTELGFEILSSNFQNIVLTIENKPKPGQLNEIEESEWVDFIMSESVGIKDEDLEEMKKDTLDNDRINKMLTQFNQTGEYEYILVGMSSKATNKNVDDLRKKYTELTFSVLEEAERSAIIKTKEDNELETMDELEKLTFVKNTALIGNLD